MQLVATPLPPAARRRVTRSAAIALSFLLLLSSTVIASSPLDAVTAALADARNLPRDVRRYVRYIEVDADTDAGVQQVATILGGHENALSRSPEIVVPIRVGGARLQAFGRRAPLLLRINIKDYGWPHQVWEDLEKQDPYYHTDILKEEFVVEEVKERVFHPGGRFRFPDGRVENFDSDEGWYNVKVKKLVSTGKKTKVRALAPWLLTVAEERLLAAKRIKEEDTAIGQLATILRTSVPVVRGRWFLQQTAAAVDRTPNYYDFLGVKNQDDFEKLVGFDEKTSRAFANLWREAVARSGVIVGKRPRRLEAGRSLGGRLWRSLDSRQTRGQNNPLVVLDDALKFDVTEQFAPLPNGMTAWYLGDNKRKRQDSAPDFIASDQSGAANDSRVHVNVSCVRCHRNASIKDFQPWARTLFKPPRGLSDPNYEKFQELRIQYLRPLEEGVEDDRRGYTRAIKLATGLTPEKWSDGYYLVFETYIEAKIDLKWAARSLGTDPKTFRAALEHEVKLAGKINNVLATFLEPEADSLSSETWEEFYPVAQTSLRGYVVKP